MTKWIAGALIVLLGFGTVFDADAQRRFGGAKNLGRQSPDVQQNGRRRPRLRNGSAPQAAPAQSAVDPPRVACRRCSPGAARGGQPGAVRCSRRGRGSSCRLGARRRRSGADVFLTVLLVGMAAMLLLGFVLRRLRGQAAPASSRAGLPPTPNVRIRNHAGAAGRARATLDGRRRSDPQRLGDGRVHAAGRDRAGSRPAAGACGLRHCRLSRSGEAGLHPPATCVDAHDLDEIAEFTTNDMFIALTHELRTRAGTSKTEVAALDAELLGIDSGSDVRAASVKLKGTLRIDGALEPVSEVWNLEKPVSGRGGWLLAGIQQLACGS